MILYTSGSSAKPEAAKQVLGRAEGHQITNVKSALAHAASGFAMHYQTVVVLGQERPGTVRANP